GKASASHVRDQLLYHAAKLRPRWAGVVPRDAQQYGGDGTLFGRARRPRHHSSEAVRKGLRQPAGLDARLDHDPNRPAASGHADQPQHAGHEQLVCKVWPERRERHREPTLDGHERLVRRLLLIVGTISGNRLSRRLSNAAAFYL